MRSTLGLDTLSFVSEVTLLQKLFEHTPVFMARQIVCGVLVFYDRQFCDDFSLCSDSNAELVVKPLKLTKSLNIASDNLAVLASVLSRQLVKLLLLLFGLSFGLLTLSEH